MNWGKYKKEQLLRFGLAAWLKYIPTNSNAFKTLLQAHFIYYKMHCISRINDTTLLKKTSWWINEHPQAPPPPFPNPRSFRPEHGPNAGLHIRKLRKFWKTICYFYCQEKKPHVCATRSLVFVLLSVGYLDVYRDPLNICTRTVREPQPWQT